MKWYTAHVFFLIFFLLPQTSLGMIEGFGDYVRRIQPQSDLLKNLIKIPEMYSFKPTFSKRIDIREFRKPNRCFVAKIHSVGVDQYFLFATKRDYDNLLIFFQNGGSRKVEWYYREVDSSLLVPEDFWAWIS